MSTMDLPITGMDCAACARKVQRALAKVPGVTHVEVLLSAEKAVITIDSEAVDRDLLAATVVRVGFDVPAPTSEAGVEHGLRLHRQVFTVLGLLFGIVLLLVVAGEGLGLLEAITERVPGWLGTGLVLVFGAPLFAGVLQSALRREVTSHTLMSVGAAAALITGQWATAALVVFFMHVGTYTERLTSEKARGLLKQLTALVPTRARVLRNGDEMDIDVDQVTVGDVVVVRPGERIPVDGTVLEGQATIDQASITGESMSVEAEVGTRVHAATLAQLGYLKITASHVGRDTTFGRTIRLVEEAEANRGVVQRVADRFSGIYLPIVALVALLTFVLGQDVMAVVAVLVVACSCSFALATPIAMMASIGAAAKRGLLIKGGKHIEALAGADVVLLDKTGTLTTGRPTLTDIVPLGDLSESRLLWLAATAERHSEHPLAEAVRRHAQAAGIRPGVCDSFLASPGRGVCAEIEGQRIEIGNDRLVPLDDPKREALEAAGKSLLLVAVDGRPAGILAVMDTVRPEAAEAIVALRRLGLTHIKLLTGDNALTAAAIATPLGLGYQADLLPEGKIAVVKDLQARGHRVVMIGDGVNDGPALAQSDVGIAMGGGTAVAMEAAHIVLMREDWTLVVDCFAIARRTMRVVRANIGFTAVYNMAGLSLAAFGIIPPVIAASLQAIPDIGILANSSRLIRQEQR